MKVEDSVGPETGRQIEDMETWSIRHSQERTAENNPDGDSSCSEAQRQHFRGLCYEEDTGPRALCSQLHRLCRQWLKPNTHTKMEMLDLVILEQFLAVLPLEVVSWIRECEPESTSQAVSLAEGFLLSQRMDKKQKEQLAVNAPSDPKERPFPLETRREKGGGADWPDLGRMLGTNPGSSLLCGGIGKTPGLLEEDPVVFEDVAVCFLEEEWALLNPDQKAQHWEVTEDNFANVASLAPVVRETKCDEELVKICVGKVTEEGKSQRIRTEAEENEPFLFPHGNANEISLQGNIDPSTESHKHSVSKESSSCQTNQRVHWQIHQERKRMDYLKHNEECCDISSLERDLIIHPKEEPFQQVGCEKSLKQNTNLNSHRRHHTGEKPFECSSCGKKFSHSSNLSRHMTIHSGGKLFPCSECGKCFSRRGNLADHMRIHTGEKSFKCSECGKLYRHRSTLRSHMWIHTGEKPFHCSECEKSFRQGATFRAHMKIHTEEKPFQCFECGKMFNRSSNLASHMRIHTGEKLFACLECGKCFKQRSHLKAHSRTHRERP